MPGSQHMRLQHAESRATLERRQWAGHSLLLNDQPLLCQGPGRGMHKRSKGWQRLAGAIVILEADLLV
jgi:hypothetical protein